MKRHLLVMCAMLLFFSGHVLGQERVVTGKVTSQEDGSPVPGVNVLLKGTATGTASDADGNYSISVTGDNPVLVFSFIGYQTAEVSVGTRSAVDVQLAVDVKQLTEVVVVGYGTQLKQDLTGNVAKVSGESIQNLSVTTLEQAIQGRAAGVLITSQNGKLGQGMNIRIRGSSSISASNEPLYVIDGMIVTTDNLSSNGAVTNPMADINSNDIASIEILKDASSAAIYGSRGANGVVLITTKRGKAGKTNFSANFQYGTSKPTNHLDFLNSAQYVELMRESALNNDYANGLDPENVPGDYAGSDLEFMEGYMDYMQGDTDWRSLETNTDWEAEAFQKATLKQFDFTANGGNEKTQFALGVGYIDQDGILIGNAFKRFSGRLNLDHTVGDKLSFGLNMMISNSINNRLSADNAFATPLQTVALAPITPVRDKEGHLYSNTDYIPGVGYAATSYYNPVMELYNASYVTNGFRNLVKGNATYKITNDLRIVGEYGFDLLTQNDDRYQNEYTDTGIGIGGYGQSRWTKVFNYTARAMFLWDKTINDHNFSVTAGTEYQEKTTDVSDAQGQGFPLKELTKLTSAAEPIVSFSSLQEESFVSFFARANYKLKDRYLVGLSGRIDGSSKFGPDSKYGFFPAASVGWILSEEGFLSGVAPISFLKLRASYGYTGNSGIANYRHLARYQGIAYGGESGLGPNTTPNPDLQWEKTAQMDIGLDFGFFNDKLTGELDYYDKQTTDLLLDAPIPATSGFTTQFRNVGELQNKGFEIVLNYQIIKNADLSVSVGGNFAQNENEITKLYGDVTQIGPVDARYLNAVIVGQPLGSFYGREFAGANPANGDALFFLNRTPTQTEIDNGVAFIVPNGVYGNRYVTRTFNTAKEIVLGNPTPKSIYGFNANATFKGFELNVLFQGVSGNKVINGGGGFMSANGRYEDNSTVDQLGRWQQPGDITKIPQARLYTTNGAQASSRYLYDGSYLRLKTLTVAYNLPTQLISRLSLTSVRLYVTGQNLLTMTDYKGWDPEVNTDYKASTSNVNLGGDFYAAPQPKNFTVGIKVGF
ncbi:MAG TPA: TonB-dependent receptor [Cyclobacteriaceae bacterium]|nr:TonB-dependent receptor [Cyclobacteriaceae bacterium]